MVLDLEITEIVEDRLRTQVKGKTQVISKEHGECTGWVTLIMERCAVMFDIGEVVKAAADGVGVWLERGGVSYPAELKEISVFKQGSQGSQWREWVATF